MFCPPNCAYLIPTEKEQSKDKEKHLCTKYKERLYHYNAHPNIYRCKECLKGISNKI